MTKDVFSALHESLHKCFRNLITAGVSGIIFRAQRVGLGCIFPEDLLIVSTKTVVHQCCFTCHTLMRFTGRLPLHYSLREKICYNTNEKKKNRSFVSQPLCSYPFTLPLLPMSPGTMVSLPIRYGVGEPRAAEHNAIGKVWRVSASARGAEEVVVIALMP